MVSSLVRSARRSQSRGNIFTIAQIFAYIRQSVSGFGGKHSKPGVDNAVKEKVKKNLSFIVRKKVINIKAVAWHLVINKAVLHLLLIYDT